MSQQYRLHNGWSDRHCGKCGKPTAYRVGKFLHCHCGMNVQAYFDPGEKARLEGVEGREEARPDGSPTRRS